MHAPLHSAANTENVQKRKENEETYAPRTDRVLPRITYGTVPVEGLNIVYREAGDPSLPKLVLLHGFPASSHQYRNLIPALARKFHVISPDYPGFGNSDMPDSSKFSYTFDRISEITEKIPGCQGFSSVWIVRRRTMAARWASVSSIGVRDLLEWLIIQNTNAYEVGFTDAWGGPPQRPLEKSYAPRPNRA